MLMYRSPYLHQMIADCYHQISFDSTERETMITDEEEAPEGTMTEICCAPSSSNTPTTPTERPFKLLVKNQVFVIDAEKFGKLSPVFNFMCFGKDFDNRELIREVVDEKAENISEFLQCIHNHAKINEWNYPTLLRLSNKYQVNSLSQACGDYVLKSNLESVKPDQILTMLIAAHDFHQPLTAIKQLILRMAAEEKVVFTRLKINRFLPGHLYAALLSTNLNLGYLKEIEGMNGHLFRVDHNKTVYKRAFCTYCKRIKDVVNVLCASHSKTNPCTSEYGNRMLQQLRQNIVEINEE
ncbi:BTB and MATH domain-containing protein 39 [Aphelenchoides bicaudatus]|nr:BTB and MATH domain-containing protein 39 [Aphelenchoides bicaudatus]